MAQVLLRDCVAEMRQHLRAGQYSDAVALGHHILRYYPKHLETYRLLAEVCLDTSDLDAATDLFQRVRSADPENVVAFIGLSIVYEHRDQVSEAIWHLERAFEIQPGNQELRKELLRLYARQDGEPPARLKLTPGALARLYARQGLYPQAIQEFRALLRADPTRFDLQVALAETLYRGGRKREAAAVAQSVLEKLPFCLKANLLLGSLWQENDVPEAESLLQRAQSVDPEHTVARELQVDHWGEATEPSLPPPGTEPPSPAINLSLVPDENLTRELSTLEAAVQPEAAEQPEPAQPVTSEAAKPDQDKTIELSSQPIAQTAEEASPPVHQVQLDQIAAGPKGEEGKPTVAPEPAPPVPAGAPSRVHPALPRTAPTIPGAWEKLPAWLRDAIVATMPSAQRVAPSPAAPTPVAPPEPRPAPTPTAPAPEAEAEVPEWLTRIREAARQQEPETGAAVQEAKPDWLVEAEKQSTSPAAAVETEVGLPDWLTVDLSQVDKQPASAESQPTIPEWLASAQPPAQAEAPVSTTTEQPPGAASQAAASLEPTMPAWLDNLPTPEVKSEAQATESDIPSWLKSAVPTADAPTVLESDEPIPDWLLHPVVRPSTAPPTAKAKGEPVAAEPQAGAQSSQVKVEPAAKTPEPSQVEASSNTQSQPRVDLPGEAAAASHAPAGEEPEAQPEAKARVLADPETMLAQARELYAQGNTIPAIELYEKVLQRGASHIPTVITDLEQLVRDPNAPLPAHRLLGDAYSMVGRFKEALDQYRLVLGR